MTRLDWKKIINVDVKQALDFYTSQGSVPGLRTVHYRLFSLGIIPNTRSSYTQLSHNTARARESGILPINCFVDDSRVVIGNYNAEIDYREPEDYIESLVYALKNIDHTYQLPRWFNQPHHVEIWSEKQAMSRTFESIVNGREINIVSNKGYTSVSYFNDNCNRLKRLVRLGKQIHILYFGDLDPSGENIEKTLRRKFFQYGLNGIDFVRIALNEDQVTAFNLPADPDAETLDKLKNDPRAGEFMINHGQLFQVEVDALHAYAPVEFTNLVLSSIDQYFVSKIHDEILDKHSAGRLHGLVSQRVKFLE